MGCRRDFHGEKKAGSWEIPEGTSCLKGGYTNMLPASLGKVEIHTVLEGIVP